MRQTARVVSLSALVLALGAQGADMAAKLDEIIAFTKDNSF